MSMTEPQGRNKSIRQVVAASFIGTTIEWYDFFLYGTAAALVFNKLFFPEAEPSSGTLLALATYGVGFAARPLGGIIFGHFGDRIGRKAMLVLSLLIMGVATFLIGAMPTYAQIGIWAPVILVLLRIAQGIGVGGEWGGAVLMSVEHARREDEADRKADLHETAAQAPPAGGRMLQHHQRRPAPLAAETDALDDSQ